MDEEQLRRWVAETLERLGTSGFRAGLRRGFAPASR